MSTEILHETDWMIAYPLKIDIHPIITWARKVQLSREGQLSLPTEHDSGLWWDEHCYPPLKERLLEICELNAEHNSYIWEFADGGSLKRHIDSTRAGTSLITVLIGRFKIYSYPADACHYDESLGYFVPHADVNPVDSYEYGPGQIVALKNGHERAHDGECLDGYRLSVMNFSHRTNDHFRNYGTLNTWNKF
jgi:hypothetical protein|tara:strand:+ start:1337 stop:1912 length:576 start_codon:yes stop_codon:yes gene_type:complete